MTETAAPDPSYRLIPSRFPPVQAFETVSTVADLPAVMELEGWTNDRLVMDRLLRLPTAEWVFGRANASIVMASFLHVAPGGSRFNGAALGAWYAAAAVRTSVAEVAHHMRREADATGSAGLTRTFRTYRATLEGRFEDLRGQAAARPDIYDSVSYTASQAFGEALRAEGAAGIVYDSLRHAGGTCMAAYRPSRIVDVVQTDHYEITVRVDDRLIRARRLGAAGP